MLNIKEFLFFFSLSGWQQIEAACKSHNGSSSAEIGLDKTASLSSSGIAAHWSGGT